MGSLSSDCWYVAAVPANEPRMLAGIWRSAIAWAMALCAALSAWPGARLNDIVVETNGPWWFTARGVRAVPKVAKAARGIIVSWRVDTEAPAEAEEWPVAAIELIARLRAESAAMVAALLAAGVDAVKAPAVALVVCAAEGLAPEVETQMFLKVCGFCQ